MYDFLAKIINSYILDILTAVKIMDLQKLIRSFVPAYNTPPTSQKKKVICLYVFWQSI